MKVILIIILLINYSYAKKDFYYSFIDSSGAQISEQRRQQISDGFDFINNAKLLARDNKIDEAYTQVKDFKEKNKINVLNSDLVLLYAELSLKKHTKRFVFDGAKELELAINSSQINEYDLAKAYMLLVELKLELNKIDESIYFANIIINNFDNELTKTYGKIYLAKVYRYQKNYDRAIIILYEILTKTNDKLVATIVADELFDVYISNGNLEKANELIKQVLKTNIDYYANDSYLANKKINKLINANMPEQAADILKELLNRTTKDESIENFKFKLANTYMLMYDRTNFYLEKAKELYSDIINDYGRGSYAKKSQMYLDEILMRQGILKTFSVAQKYEKSESMQQKALLQELLNNKEDKKYEYLLRSRKIYNQISTSIINRFAYKSIEEIFDDINIDMIKDQLSKNQCFELDKSLKNSRKETLEKLIYDESIKFKFFECLVEVPYERGYELVKDAFNNSRDANIYLYLERMALSLGLLDEALDYSTKVEMVDNKNVLTKEFLYRYQILKAKADAISLEKFFSYTQRNLEFIELNENNPIIIDFYYDYYFYLLKKDEEVNANEVLVKLYNKQKLLKANIYSPFVEMELSRIAKSENNTQKSLDYLLEGLKNTRRIKANDEAKIYYDILKLYDVLSNDIKKEEYINKCKNVKGTNESLYKKMCDEM
ncbi:tetratricopeptide repeat protein [Poseidonibacter sp.]|uniref:tetratricopeptide repeat protein n=1 Tax=Poseidonibacter sp. TaxID=2321188 RepID=UPI003C7247A6